MNRKSLRGSPGHRGLSNPIRLGAVRAGFALGGRIAPQRTVERAARLFATPFASSRSRAQAAILDADVHCDQVRVGSESIATYTWGDPQTQPYALLVHGWSSFALRFKPWVAHLRELGLAVVSFDQPGHGLSSGELCTLPDFTRTVRTIGQMHGPAAAGIGHSLGGAALALAQDEHWSAQRMILVAPVAGMHGATNRFFRFLHLGSHLREPFKAWHEKQTGIRVGDLDLHRHLPALGQPGLIVHDLNDRDVAWDEGERYARYWPGARLLTTQGLGHHRILDAADVLKASTAFLRGETVGERVVSTPNLPFGVS